MAYSVIDKVYTIFIDVMTGSSNGYGKPTFYNTDSHTSFIELTVTNGSKEFNMTEFSYMFTVEKPDGTKYTNEYTTKDKNKLVIPVDAQMISCTGNCNAQLYVNKEVDGVNKTLTMVEFNYTVYKGLHEGLISESVDFDNVYIKILNKLDYIINNGADLTGDQAAQLTYAYQHSKSPHAPANIVETMHTEIGEAIDAHHKKVALSASQVGNYRGVDITVKPSQEGLTKYTRVRGRTLQNVCVKPIFNTSGSHTKEDMAEYIKATSIDASFCYVIVEMKGTLFAENKPYTLVYDREDSSDSTNITLVRCIYTDGTFLDTTVRQTGKVVASFTPKKPINRIEMYCYATRDTVKVGAWVKVHKKVMILEGDYTTPDAYIPPYFEGIRSVGDKSKNLFKGYDQEIQLEAGKTYYLSSANTIGATRIYIKPTAKDDISSNQMYWQDSSNRYALSANNTLLRVTITCNKNTTILASTGDSTKYKNIQLEEGAVATAYEPYFEEGTSLVSIGSCGKNLFDYASTNVISESVTKNNTNGFTLKDYSNDARISFVSMFPNLRVGKTYTYSAVVDTKGHEGTSATGSIGFYDRATRTMFLYVPSGTSFKVTEKIKSSDVFLYGVTGNSIDINNIQIEEGTVATEYTSYQEDIKVFTAPITDGLKGLLGGTDDVAFVELEKKETWVEQNILMHTFDGKEAWQKTAVEVGTDVNTIRFQTSLPEAKDAAGDKFISNYPTSALGTYGNDRENIQVSNKIFYIRVNKDKLETQDEAGFKKWLQRNPVTICYQLAKPRYVRVTPTDMINLKTSNEATSVFSMGDIKPTISFSLDTVMLTTDAKQFCTSDDNKNFVLPDVSSLVDNNALEIHLFVKMLANATLSFPSNILWNDLAKMNEVTKGSTAEFIFTYIKTADGGSWLGTVVPHK